jgi:hypothetical protein
MTHVVGVYVSGSLCAAVPMAPTASCVLAWLLTPNCEGRCGAGAIACEDLTATPTALFQHGERTIRATARPEVECLWHSVHHR